MRASMGSLEAHYQVPVFYLSPLRECLGNLRDSQNESQSRADLYQNTDSRPHGGNRRIAPNLLYKIREGVGSAAFNPVGHRVR